VPTGKPDGRADAATEETGVGGLSVSMLGLALVPVLGVDWLSAGKTPPVVECGLQQTRSVSGIRWQNITRSYLCVDFFFVPTATPTASAMTSASKTAATTMMRFRVHHPEPFWFRTWPNFSASL
jgi:hypothetical protein